MAMEQAIIGRDFPKVVIPLIEAARKTIDIVVFDWRWYPDNIGSSCQLFNAAIAAASRRSVRVRVITNTYRTVDTLKKLGVEAHHYSSGKILHAKLMVIDGAVAVTGSHNYTVNAFNMNHEVSVLLDDKALVLQLLNFISSLWSL